MKILIPLLVIALTPMAIAAEPDAADLDRMVARLGDARFQAREAASQALLERAKGDLKGVRAVLQERLADEEDPEIRARLQAILRVISPGVPLAVVKFTKDAFEDGIWGFHGDPPKRGRFEFKKAWLEIDSLAEVTEALGFMHRIPRAAAEQADRRFGVRPAPAPAPQRMVLDAEIKVLEQNLAKKGLVGVHLNVEDHRSSAALMILPDGVFAYRQQHVHRMDTTDRWHHYRFVIEGARQEIFVDDMEKPVLALQRPRGAGRQWASFGDGTAGAGARAQIRNVTFTRYPARKAQ